MPRLKQSGRKIFRKQTNLRFWAALASEKEPGAGGTETCGSSK